MSKSRGLISGGDVESRSSGMYDSHDNIRIASISIAGLNRVGLTAKTVRTTGFTYPYSFAWSPDGLHLYISYSADYIRYYTVTKPFTDEGISTQATFNASVFESAGFGIEISPDGRYLYWAGDDEHSPQQFTMVNNYEVLSSADNTTFSPGYEQQNKRLDNIFSIGSADASVRGIEFNDDGTKMYLIGFGDDNIQQFSLSTAYTVGTASYDGAYNVGGDGIGNPYNMRWNDDGSKFFVVDYNLDSVIEYSASNAYDVTTGTITEGTNFSVNSYENNPYDVAFNADGTKMFVIGNGSDKIHEWTLSTGFDLSSTVTYVSGTSLGLSNPGAFDFSPDGTLMAVVDWNDDFLKGYTLSTGFDSSTISSTQTLDLSEAYGWPTSSGALTNYMFTPTGCRFNGDGTTITIMDRYNNNTDKVVTTQLTVPYDVRGFADGIIDANDRGVATPSAIRFNRDGTKLYLLDRSDDKIYQWTLHVPYVLGRGTSVCTYDGVSGELTAPDPQLRSFDWTPDGKGIFTCGTSNDTIAFWTVSTPYDVTNTITYQHAFDTTSLDNDPWEIRVINCYNKGDGSPGYKLHMLGVGAKKIFEFDINF